MKKIVKIALSAMVMLSMSAVTLNAGATADKGQKLYLKKLKSACGFSGAVMAAKHTGDEWSEIDEGGTLTEEIRGLCPKVKDSALKEKYLPFYIDFFKEYSSDSGNIPSC